MGCWRMVRAYAYHVFYRGSLNPASSGGVRLPHLFLFLAIRCHCYEHIIFAASSQELLLRPDKINGFAFTVCNFQHALTPKIFQEYQRSKKSKKSKQVILQQCSGIINIEIEHIIHFSSNLIGIPIFVAVSFSDTSGEKMRWICFTTKTFSSKKKNLSL